MGRRALTACLAIGEIIAFCVSPTPIIFADNSASNFTTLDDPLALPGETFALGISNGVVVGYYVNETPALQGFMYSGGIYSPLNYPSTTDPFIPYGISNGTVAGTFSDASGSHGLIETSGAFTTVDIPNALGQTGVYGISGNMVVGEYLGGHGFSETTGNVTTLDFPAPLVSETVARGVSGNTIVGYYTDNQTLNIISGEVTFDYHGFSETNGDYTKIEDPQANPGNTWAYGISGEEIVGTFGNSTGSHGFVDINGSFFTIDDPSANVGTTRVYGISDGMLVGTYDDVTGTHGFIASLMVPEPASLFIIGLSSLLLTRKERSKN